MSKPTHLVVGHVTKPHGTKGELFVWPLTDSIEEVFADGRSLLVGDDKGNLDPAYAEPIVVESTREFKRGVLLKITGRNDRDSVDEFAQRYLLAPVEELSPPAEDEVYYHQLLNMKVVTKDGLEVGQVREVYETYPAHMLEVAGEGGKTHLIPFADRIVRKVDVEAGQIVIAPTPGLLDV
ncbi:MAG TPA: ribosome maturation factor RimM [Longimicrobiales bacterium]|nr:ribosome maturation factor RimM [Longimicrobiales bacterium]